jgi:glycosyltransferase involved in cell wall biosynthesis
MATLTKQVLVCRMQEIHMITDTPANEVCRLTLSVIPALNEEATLPRVLSDVKCRPLAGVRVVDNGSTDDTVKLAVRNGAEFIEEPVRGYGSVCWKAIQDLSSSAASRFTPRHNPLCNSSRRCCVTRSTAEQRPKRPRGIACPKKEQPTRRKI